MYITLQEEMLTLHINRLTETIRLNPGDIYKSVINNPLVISEHITTFIKQHRLSRVKAILNLPWLSSIKEHLHPFAVLQAALCITQTPVMLEKIISTQTTYHADDYNYLSLLHNQTRSPQSLLIALCCCIGTSMGGLLFYKKHLQKELLYCTPRSISSKQKIQNATTFHKELSVLQKKVVLLKAKSACIDNYQQQNQRYATYLKQIAHFIPSDTMITKLSIEPTSTQNQATRPLQSITMTGLSYSVKSITSFIETLRKQNEYNTISLLSIEQQSEQNDTHLFTIHGIVR